MSRQHDEAREKKRGSGKGSGGGITSRLAGNGKAPGNGTADWARCDSDAIRAMVAWVTISGAAILLGYSRDRGAYRVHVMDDDGKFTEWIPCTSDVSEAVWELAARFESAVNQAD